MIFGNSLMMGGGRKTVEFVGAAAASGTSIPIPAHQPGDLIIIFAMVRHNTDTPAVGSGFTSIGTHSAGASADRVACRIGYRFAVSSSETSGTWQDTNSMACGVYRGVQSIGNHAFAGNTGVRAFWPALAAAKPPAMLVGLGGHAGAGTLSDSGADGYVMRAFQGAVNRAVIIDTNGEVASRPQTNDDSTSTAGRWITSVVELNSRSN